jgi:hypothetical protein
LIALGEETLFACYQSMTVVWLLREGRSDYV